MDIRSWFTRKKTIPEPTPAAPAKHRGVAPIPLADPFRTDVAPPDYSSLDGYLQSRLTTLRSKSREALRSNPLAISYANLMTANIVGSTGITVQVQLKTKTGNLAKSVNDSVEKGWARFWAAPTFDPHTTGTQLLNIMVRTEVADGEVFARLVNLPADDPRADKFAVQLLPAELLETSDNIAPSATREGITMGVRKDAYGRPVGYRFRETPMGQVSEIPAHTLIHKFRQLEVGQTRGLPMLAPVLENLEQLKGYIHSVIVAERVAAGKMAFLVRKDDSPMSDDEDSPADQQIAVVPGSLTQLPDNFDLREWNPTASNANFGSVVSTLAHNTSSALGVSYNALTGDLSNINYSTVRAGMLQERDQFRTEQQAYIDRILRPIFRAWLQQAVLSRNVDIGTRTTVEDIVAATTFTPRGWDWIDPLKDWQASILAVQHGFTSRTKVLAEIGENFESVASDIAAEQQLAADLCLNLDAAGIRPIQKPNPSSTAANTLAALGEQPQPEASAGLNADPNTP